MSLDRQGDLFADIEGDRWFDRNRGALERWDAGEDTPMTLLALVEPPPGSVLELGAANGYRVAAIVALHSCRGVAVEPSAAAIADGASRYPGVEFHRGRIDSVPLDESFAFRHRQLRPPLGGPLPASVCRCRDRSAGCCRRSPDDR